MMTLRVSNNASEITEIAARPNFEIAISPYSQISQDSVFSDPLLVGMDKFRSAAASWLDGAAEISFFKNARSALWVCLKYLRLNSSDEVYIHTTSGGPYVSSCVTETIGAFCQSSRVIGLRTKLILIIHEFGFPCDESRMRQLAALGMPILEDCAYAAGSRIQGAAVGRIGDFAIYSFYKHYAVPRGGALVSRHSLRIPDLWTSPEVQERTIPAVESSALQAMLLMHAETQSSWNAARRSNWQYFEEQLAKIGVVPYFGLDEGVVPGAFVCKLPPEMSGDSLKKKFVQAGIEATEYYGHGGFYFPVHQMLTHEQKISIVRLFGN
jgi:hypothetical protein